jgi:L-alanine-DL-glutamate epimerase-like enolase superfamily enzyme
VGGMGVSSQRRFVLRRNEDETGISGVGEVAEGVQFTDGTCAMRWRTALASTAVYDSVDDVEAIHGHQSRTLIVWVDEL